MAAGSMHGTRVGHDLPPPLMPVFIHACLSRLAGSARRFKAFGKHWLRAGFTQFLFMCTATSNFDVLCGTISHAVYVTHTRRIR